MTDVFSLNSEVSNKDKLISQFSEWWPDEEIRARIIPFVVDEKIKASIDGALNNYLDSDNSNSKNFAEILYDLVGQNFLVNPDKSIRCKFLYLILKKKSEEDSSFEDRFRKYLIKKIKSNSPGSCKKCSKKWIDGDIIYLQTLGLPKTIICSNNQCIYDQQNKLVPNISDPIFIDFILKFDLKKDYKFLCKKLIDEFDFPDDVIVRPSREIKLLPETIKPLGGFTNLYDFQSSIGLQIIDMLENYEIDTSRALVVLPTGAGKTRLIVETLIDWINNGKKGKENSKFVLWIVDRNELCQQAFDTFADVFRHRGKKDSSLKIHPIYGDNQKNITDILYQYSDLDDGEIREENGVIIASIQSLFKMTQNDDKGSLPELAKYTSIVIIDEAHHAVSSNKSYTSVLHALGFRFRNVMKKGVDINENHTCLLGVTATPFRGTDELGKSTTDLLNRFGKKHRILWPPFSEQTQIENFPPIANLDVQRTGFENERIKLYGQRSYDKDGKIHEYHFIIKKTQTDSNFSDNPLVLDKWYKEKNIDFTFNEPGMYHIQLTVKDDDGVESRNFDTAISTIEIFPKEQREEKTNVEEMKKIYKYLIKREILAKPHHYIIDNSKRSYDTTRDIERSKQFHDITHATLSHIGNDAFRNNKIINKIISLVKKEERKSILLFACSVEHSKLLSFVLDAIYGIKSASIDHTTSPEERDQSINDFRTGKISVLCNYDILTTGFDAPKVECVFVTRPTFSHLLYNQMTGRGLRGPRNNGTANCVIVDISDNIQLESDDGLVEQPWRIFDYIYETTYDERDEGKKEQKCYGCFGLKQRKFDGELQNCEICNGVGTISLKKEPQIDPNSKIEDQIKFQNYQKEIFRKHSDWSLKEIKAHAKSKLKYNKVLESKTNKTKPPVDWGALCKNCGKTSSNMPKTLAHFGRSEKLISKKNPKGIFEECKECRNKNEDSVNYKNFEYTKCPKCGKTASGRDQVERLFGLRLINGKFQAVQSWCIQCRKS